MLHPGNLMVLSTEKWAGVQLYKNRKPGGNLKYTGPQLIIITKGFPAKTKCSEL